MSNLTLVRRWSIAGICWAATLGGAAAAVAQEAPASAAPAAAQESPEADAATKRLLAAQGLATRGLWKLAAEEYAGFIKDHPRHPQGTTACYMLAWCRYNLGQFDEAAALAGEALKDPNFKDRDKALAMRGYGLLVGRKYDEALAAFEELLAKYPKSAAAETAAINRAQTLYLAGRKPEAIVACQGFLKDYPESGQRPAAMYFLALTQQAGGKLDEAAATAAQIQQQYPNSPQALDSRLLLGQCLEAQGKLGEAAEQYRQMVKAAPPERQIDGRYSLGVALYKAAKYDEAVAELSAVAAGGKDSPQAAAARMQLGLAQLAAGKPAAARTTLEQVVQQDSSRAATARYWLAQCDIADRKYEAARKALDQLAATNPPNADHIAFDRAVCAMAMDQHEQAAGEFEAFRKRYATSPQVADALYRQAFCLHKLAQYDQSHALLADPAIKADAKLAAAAGELDAENLFMAGKYADAQKLYEAMQQSARNDEQRLRNALRLGQCAYYSADYARALQALKPVADEAAAQEDEELRLGVFLSGDAYLQMGDNAGAAKLLRRYLDMTKRPRHEALFKLALAQMRGNDARSAEQTFAELVTGPGDSPWVQRGLFEFGQMYYRQKQPQKAYELLTRAIAKNPPEDVAVAAGYLLGWIDYEGRHYAEAAVRFGQIVEKYQKNPSAADACFQQAAALSEAGEPAAALEAIKRYAKLWPDGKRRDETLRLEAACLDKLGRHEEAIKVLASLASQDKAADAVLYEMAWSQRAMKDSAGAIATYQRLLKDHPKSPKAMAARVELADVLEKSEKYDQAVELLAQVVHEPEVDPKLLVLAQYHLGWCYSKLNRHAQAATVLAAFAEEHQDDALAASALYQAGESRSADSNLAEAQNLFRRLVDRYPQHELAPAALLKLAQAQADAGNFDTSAQSYGQFLQKYPQDKFAYLAHFGLGWSAENRKRYDEARREYEKVIAGHNGPTAARAQFQIGETWFAEQKFEPAVAALLAVADVYAYPEWSARALYEAGRVFEQLKNVEQARQQYTAVVEKYKDAPEAALARKRLDALK